MDRSCKRHPCKGYDFTLPVSDGLCLIHDPRVGQGKTTGMAKGLMLCWQGCLCAGESAGLGLPVWKTGQHTFFPTLIAIKPIGETIIVKKFRLDREVVWRIAGKKAPAWVNLAMECLTSWYMKQAELQHRLLMLRDLALTSFAMHSTMEAGVDKGSCQVTYETIQQGLKVQVDCSSMQDEGQLIVLNELDGQSFDQLRIDDRVWQGSAIPAWQAVPFHTVLESALFDLGISISPNRDGNQARVREFCGREVALGLDWAGLTIMSQGTTLAYQIRFHL